MKQIFWSEVGKSMKKVLFIFPLIFIFLMSRGHAETLWQTSISYDDLTDQRTFSSSNYNPSSSEGGLDGYWPYSFTIGWDISSEINDTGMIIWTYEYKLSAERKDISHFILEISGSAEEGSFYDVKIDGNPADFEGTDIWGSHQGRSNPGIPADFYGIKFDAGGSTVTYSFTTELDPVWGNFYAKSGKDKGKWVYAYNNALGYEGFESMNKLDFIPRPDGGGAPPVVPEPLSALLFTTGGAVFGGRLYWKKRKRNTL